MTWPAAAQSRENPRLGHTHIAGDRALCGRRMAEGAYVKRISVCWACISLLGCAGQMEGGPELLDEDEREAVVSQLSGATQMLQRGHATEEVADAFPMLVIDRKVGSRRIERLDPNAPTDGRDIPDLGRDPFTTPEQPGAPEGDPLPELDPTLDPAGPSDPNDDLPPLERDPTLDPDRPGDPDSPAIPEIGDDAISVTCRSVCTDHTTTECSVVAADPVLGTGVTVRVCREVVRRSCSPVCSDDPPNA